MTDTHMKLHQLFHKYSGTSMHHSLQLHHPVNSHLMHMPQGCGVLSPHSLLYTNTLVTCILHKWHVSMENLHSPTDQTIKTATTQTISYLFWHNYQYTILAFLTTIITYNIIVYNKIDYCAKTDCRLFQTVQSNYRESC